MLMREIPEHIKSVKNLNIKITVPKNADDNAIVLMNELYAFEGSEVVHRKKDSSEITWNIDFRWDLLNPNNEVHFDLGYAFDERRRICFELYDYADEENKDKLHWLMDLIECVGAQTI